MADPRGLQQHGKDSGRREGASDQRSRGDASSRHQEAQGPADAGITRQRDQDEDRGRVGEALGEVRVTVRIQNALILRKMEEVGIKSVAELARKINVSQTDLGRIINLKESGRQRRDCEWRRVVLRLSKLFRCLPEELISEQQEYQGLKKTVASRDISMDEIEEFLSEGRIETPEENLLRSEGIEAFQQMLMSLTPKEQHIMTLHYGLDGGGERTQAEIADLFGVSRTRIWQSVTKCLRKLKHPSRLKQILPYTKVLGNFESPRRWRQAAGLDDDEEKR